MKRMVNRNAQEIAIWSLILYALAMWLLWWVTDETIVWKVTAGVVALLRLIVLAVPLVQRAWKWWVE